MIKMKTAETMLCFAVSILCLLTLTVDAYYNPINILVLKPSTVPRLNYKIENGLAEAIRDLHGKISVLVEENAVISSELLKQCSSQGTSLLSVNDHQTGFSGIVDTSAGLPLHRYNFALTIEINSPVCFEDMKLLASAKPCGVAGNRRPLLGSLNICTGGRWQNFKAAGDLFRHEILHALGFGTIVPTSAGQIGPAPDRYEWKQNGWSQPATRTYLDFAQKALPLVRTHFDCPSMVGVEADSGHKIHLNEYIFGNELMTPKLSNNKNLFTLISATILEQTFVGARQWYIANKTAIEEETRQFWFGKKWGCDFVQKSCYEYMENSNVGFPFCPTKSYIQGQRVQYCVKRDGRIGRFVSSCSEVKLRPLIRADNGIKATPVNGNRYWTGSEAVYRFCPMNQDFINDRIELSTEAEIRNCE